MIRVLAIVSLLVIGLTGCAGTAMKNPGLMAEADRSEQRAIAAQKAGAREVAHIQDDRADRLRASAANYSFGDWVADTLVNFFLDNAESGRKRR